MKIADDIVSDYVAVEDYEIETEYMDDRKAYVIIYKKVVNNLPAYDSFSVRIYADGTVGFFLSCNPGMIDKNATIDIDREKVEAELIDIALNGGKAKDARIKEAHLTVLPDGRPAIEYDVVVTYELMDDMTINELISFYVIGKGE